MITRRRDARMYMDGALRRIRMADDVETLRHWWRAQAKFRRLYVLGDRDYEILLDAIHRRFPTMELPT